SAARARARRISSQVLSHDALVRLAVALARALHHVRWKGGCGRLLVPAALHEEIAHVLLVERGRRAAGLVHLGVPVARGVRGQDLVDQRDAAVEHPELELRVGEDEALRGSVVVGEPVERERESLEVPGELGADHARELRAADVLVVARLGLRGRREDRLGELLRLDERLWKLLARDRAERFVFGPGGTGDVAAGDALDVDALAVLHEHRPPGERTRIAKRLWKAAEVGRDEVIRHDLLGLAEPEVRELRQDAALVGYRRREDRVEGRQSIARDDDELVASGFVDISDLATAEEGGAVDPRFEKDAHSEVTRGGCPSGARARRTRCRARPRERDRGTRRDA